MRIDRWRRHWPTQDRPLRARAVDRADRPACPAAPKAPTRAERLAGRMDPCPRPSPAKRPADRMAPCSTSRNPCEPWARPARPTASGLAIPPDDHRAEGRSWAALPRGFRNPWLGRCPPCRCRPGHRRRRPLLPPRQPPAQHAPPCRQHPRASAAARVPAAAPSTPAPASPAPGTKRVATSKRFSPNPNPGRSLRQSSACTRPLTRPQVIFERAARIKYGVHGIGFDDRLNQAAPSGRRAFRVVEEPRRV